MGPSFVEAMPIGQFRGVGPATQAKMRRLSIQTGADLKARSPDELRAAFGSVDDSYHQVAQGIDDRPVRAHRTQAASGTGEVTSNIAGVAQVSEETGAAASQVLSAASELSRQCEHLGAEVTRFLDPVQAA